MAVILIVVLAALFAVSSIYIKPRFIMSDEGFRITVTAYFLMKLIKIKRQIGPEGISKPGGKGKKGAVKINRLSEAYVLVKRIRNIYDTAEDAIKYVKKKIDVREIRITTVIGAGDAYLTALSVGMACTVAGNIVAVISNIFPKCIKNIGIIPDFSGKSFKLDLYCILKIKTAHIIVAGFKLLISVLVIKMKSARAKHIKSGI